MTLHDYFSHPFLSVPEDLDSGCQKISLTYDKHRISSHPHQVPNNLLNFWITYSQYYKISVILWISIHSISVTHSLCVDNPSHKHFSVINMFSEHTVFKTLLSESASEFTTLDGNSGDKLCLMYRILHYLLHSDPWSLKLFSLS